MQGEMENKKWRPQTSFQKFIGCLPLCAFLYTAGASCGESAVKFNGVLVSEPCTLDDNSKDLVVDFGEVSKKFLYINHRTAAKKIQLNLKDCDLALGSVLKIKFDGVQSQALPGYLSLSKGNVNGVAIGLETDKGKLIPINEATEGYTLQSGDNLITVGAFLQGEPDALLKKNITGGAFNITASYILEYP